MPFRQNPMKSSIQEGVLPSAKLFHLCQIELQQAICPCEQFLSGQTMSAFGLCTPVKGLVLTLTRPLCISTSFEMFVLNCQTDTAKMRNRECDLEMLDDKIENVQTMRPH